MKYNQENLNEFNKGLPYLFWRDLERELNKRKKKRLHISTIKDILKVFRGGTHVNLNGGGKIEKAAIFEKALKLKAKMLA